MATFSGVDDPGRGCSRPFWYDGAWYMVARNSSTTTAISVEKATDPTGTWTGQDTANEPDTGDNTVQAIAVTQHGQYLYIAFQQIETAGPARDSLFFARFDCSDDTFDQWTGASEQTLHTENAGDLTGCDIAVGPGGEVAVVAQSAPENVSGFKPRVSLYTAASSDLTSWTDRGHLETGVAFGQWAPKIEWSGSAFHAVYVRGTSAPYDLYSVAISLTYTIGTVRDTTFNVGGNSYHLGFGTVVVVAGTASYVMFPYMNNSADLHALRFTASSDPSSFSSDSISADQPKIAGYTSACLTFDGRTARAAFIKNSDSDIYRDEASPTTWGTDTSVAVGTYNNVWCNTYDDAGPKLGIISWSGSAFDYHEVSVAESFTNLSDIAIGPLPCFPGPFEVGAARYMVGRHADGHRLYVLKETDGTPIDSDWSMVGELQLWQGARHCQDQGSYPLSGELRGYGATVYSSDLYIVHQTEGGALGMSVFDPGTDAFTTVYEHIADPVGDTNWGPVSSGNAEICIDSAGVIVVVASYHDASNNKYLRVFRKSGGTWSNTGLGDDSGSTTSTANFSARMPESADSSDRISWTFYDQTNAHVRLMSISSAGTLSSNTSIDSAVDTGVIAPNGKPVITGNTIYAPYTDADNKITVADWTSGASPTVNTTTAVSDATVYRNSTTTPPFAGCNVFAFLNSTTPGMAYVDATGRDIDMEQDVTSIGTDTEILASTAAGPISGRVISSTLWVLYEESGTLKSLLETLNNDVNVSVSTATIAFTANQATVDHDISVDVAAGSIAFSTQQATVDYDVDVSVALGSITFTPQQATVDHDVSVDVAAGSIAFSTHAATVDQDTLVSVALGSITFTPNQATVDHDISVDVAAGNITFSTHAATIGTDVNVNVSVGSITFTKHNAFVDHNIEVDPTPATITFTPQQADVAWDREIDAAAASITFTANQADIDRGFEVDAAAGSITFSPQAATVTALIEVDVATAAMTLTPLTAEIGFDADISVGTASITFAPFRATVTNPAGGPSAVSFMITGPVGPLRSPIGSSPQ